MPVRKAHHRRAAAVVLGLAGAAVIGASAASLGDADSVELGADAGVVVSCDTNGVDVRYRTAYHRPSGQFRVNRVVIRDVSAECAGLAYRLTLVDDDGTPYEVSGNSLLVTNIRDRQPGPGVDLAGVARIPVVFPAADVAAVAIVIGGTAVL